MKLIDYRFHTRSWPPPKDRREPGTYLFAFDSDNQPYIVSWEHSKGYEGWVATTLSRNKSNGHTAVPRHIVGDTVDKLIEYWADAPCLMKTIREAREYYGEEDDDKNLRYY